MALFVAGPVAVQQWEQLSGRLVMLPCIQNPVEPVTWTFRSSSDSVVEDVEYLEGFHVQNSSLVIHSVEAGDSGLYNCSDAAGALHTIQLTVIGKVCELLLYSKFL